MALIDKTERYVIPRSKTHCVEIALLEALFNYEAYIRGNRSIAQLQYDIFIGKLAEALFAFYNRKNVVKGVRIFGLKPDNGTDLILQQVGNVQIKTCFHPDYVNDNTGTKKAKWPTADVYLHDNCLLVVAFVSEDWEIQFMCQAPTKLHWKKSNGEGWYLVKTQFIEWTDDANIFAKLGTFPKLMHPEDDMPDDVQKNTGQ